MKVVIVPGTNPVAQKIEAYLGDRRIDVVMASDGPDAINAVAQEKPAAIVAVDERTTAHLEDGDRNLLPESGDGVDAALFARGLREGGDNTPLLVITDRDAPTRAVNVLDSGADDVASAKAALPEVGSRIRALARRCHAVTGNPRHVGNLSIDVDATQVTLGGRDVKLTQREFAVLEYLSRNVSKFVPRDTLLDACWPATQRPKSNVVDVIVGRLRAKMLAVEPLDYIDSARGRGYRLLVPHMHLETSMNQ
jgi:DNA-binding response OmpR family regulator